MEEDVLPTPPLSLLPGQAPSTIGAQQELTVPTMESLEATVPQAVHDALPHQTLPDASQPSGDDNATHEKPFVIHLVRLDQEDNGHFRPGAVVELSQVLRTSGLLALLPAEEVQTLLCILTFVTANGACLPTVTQIAEALHIGERVALARLERLLSYKWNERSVLHKLPRETGMDAYSPTAAVVVVRAAPDPSHDLTRAPAFVAAGRETIIAHSRATYARPRMEIEREIARNMGWADPHPQTPQEVAEATLRSTLSGMGISSDQIHVLLATYPIERIQRQMEWLPYRHAIHPARFLLAAIAGDYEPPQEVRMAALQREDEPAIDEAFAPEEAEQGTSIVVNEQETDSKL